MPKKKASELKKLSEKITDFALEQLRGLTLEEKLRVLEKVDAVLGGLKMDLEMELFDRDYKVISFGGDR